MLSKKLGLFCLIASIITLTSCSCLIKGEKNKFKYNREFFVCNCNKVEMNGIFEQTLKDSCNKGINYEYLYCPVLINKKANNIGIYQFWCFSLHKPTDYFFLYNGNNIEIVNNSNLSYVEQQLENYGFKSKRIKRIMIKINECIAINKTKNNSF
jgi:hypothetical protein